MWQYICSGLLGRSDVGTPPGRQRGSTLTSSISWETYAILSPLERNELNQMESALLILGLTT